MIRSAVSALSIVFLTGSLAVAQAPAPPAAANAQAVRRRP